MTATNFTLEQIKTAHSKVRSGADFPAYIREIKHLGVIFYKTYVSDGHTDYFGENDYKASTPPQYEPLSIAEDSDAATFKANLKTHQQGQTDYLTFCKDCARSGIEKWAVCMDKMMCTYYDKPGVAILIEVIPG